MDEDITKFKVKHWAIQIHRSKISTALYGFITDTSKDRPHSFSFGLSGIRSPQEISWGILGEKYVPKYVKEAVYKKIVEFKGKQNVRKGF